MNADSVRGAVIVRGYWCPVCSCAFRAHTDAELLACAEQNDRSEDA